MASVPAQRRFQKLVEDIGRLYVDARKAQVRFAWETGRRIVEEEQDGALRAAYGAGLIPKLSKELSKKYGPGFSENALKKTRQFYLLNPIRPTSVELSWSQHIELLPVKDDKMRERLQRRALKESLNARQMRRLVREVGEKEEAKPLPPLKRPTDLKLNTFAVSELSAKLPAGQVLIDCGFFVSWPVSKDEVKALDIPKEMSYTYAATIDRVIDGDTLLVLIEVGFGILVHDRLRLRGVDTPEVSTPEGRRAKRFVEQRLPQGARVVIKSHKWRTDPHGRFVADVFYKKGAQDATEILENGTYLNQELLDEGFAARMEES